MADLRNRVVMVTGAAGGIGGGTVKVLLASGATVVATDRDSEGLEKLAQTLDSEHLTLMPADLGDDEVHARLVTSICERHSRIDGAVLNAGMEGINTPIEDYPVELFDQVMGINMRAVWLSLRALAPVMKQQNSGSIVLTSSVQGLAAMGGTTAYTTSKHALVGMMKGASLELAPFNVRVNTVHPGFVDTAMMERIHHAASPDDTQAVAGMLAKTVPMQRYASPEEIGQLMAFLISNDSSYSTGSCFVADGGTLASL